MGSEDKSKVDNGEFQRLLMKKHHTEMIDALKGIKFPQPKDNSALMQKIDTTLSVLAAKLDVISSPKVNIEKTVVDQSAVINTLKELIIEVKALKSQEVKEVMVEKKEGVKEKKSYTFTINRDNNGFIQSVTANQQ